MSTFKKIYGSQLIQLSYFLLGALCVSIKSGYSIAPTILMLFGLGFLIMKPRPQLDKNAQILLYAFLAYVAVQGISLLWDGGSVKEFDRPSRALMAILILIAALKYPPRFLWLMNGFAVGAIAAGIRAIWDRQFAGLDRAFGWMMPIQGGDISMSLGILSLCGLMWAIKNTHSRYMLFYAMATVMGIFGSILSGSRGGWVLFPIILLVAYQIFKDWFNPQVKKGLALALLIFAVICALPQSGIPTRIDNAREDISLYFSGKDKHSSLGDRFEFWKSAVDSFIQKPVFGWGNNGVHIPQEAQYKRGFITQIAFERLTQKNAHAHNQFLDEMSKRGVIGLAALLAFFFVPLMLFKKYLQQSATTEEKTIAACGILLVLSTIDYCLSQAFLSHNSGITFYTVYVVILFAFLNRAHRT